MDCRVLPLRQLPHQPKLFLEYLDDFEKVKSFYAHPPAMAAVTRVALKLEYPEDRRGGRTFFFCPSKNAPGGRAGELFPFYHPEKKDRGGVSALSLWVVRR